MELTKENTLSNNESDLATSEEETNEEDSNFIYPGFSDYMTRITIIQLSQTIDFTVFPSYFTCFRSRHVL